MQPSSFQIALARYARLRRTAYDSVAEEAVRTGLAPSTLRLTDIDERALSAWRETWQGRHRSGGGGWDWERVSRPFRRRPSAFHLALWSGEVLCGLAVGRASAKRRNGARHMLSVHYMEGAPDPDHPLAGRVALVMLTAAAVYAGMLGASRLRLIDPLPGVLPLYSKLGFSVAASRRKPLYCEKRI